MESKNDDTATIHGITAENNAMDQSHQIVQLPMQREQDLSDVPRRLRTVRIFRVRLLSPSRKYLELPANILAQYLPYVCSSYLR